MAAMIRSGLEFAPGTTDDCKKLVGSLFQPSDLLGAYREMRVKLKSGDLVIVASNQEPEFRVETRLAYVNRLKDALGARNSGKRLPAAYEILAFQSAHRVVQLPSESEAFWLVIERGRELPVICPIFTTPYQIDGDGANTHLVAPN